MGNSRIVHNAIALFSFIGIVISLIKISSLEQKMISTEKKYEGDRKALVSYYTVKLDSLQSENDSLRFQIEKDQLIIRNNRPLIIYRDTCLERTKQFKS